MGVSASSSRNSLDQRERLAQGLPRPQRPETRGLDRRAVGHRIGEGHAELDQVRARRRQGFDDRQRSRRVRIARHDERDQPRASRGAEGLELGVDAARHARVVSM